MKKSASARLFAALVVASAPVLGALAWLHLDAKAQNPSLGAIAQKDATDTMCYDQKEDNIFYASCGGFF